MLTKRQQKLQAFLDRVLCAVEAMPLLPEAVEEFLALGLLPKQRATGGELADHAASAAAGPPIGLPSSVQCLHPLVQGWVDACSRCAPAPQAAA